MDDALVIAIAAGVALVFIIYGIISAGRRRKELYRWAMSKGLTFESGKDRDFGARYHNFDCLQKGDSRYAYNIMEGLVGGMELLCCDYHYGTGSGKSRQEHYFSLVIVKSPILLEPLLIRPENFLDRFAELAGFDDIDFESAAFSRKFFVKAPNKRWAYDIIHPRMMEYLMQGHVFSVQFDTPAVIVYRDTIFETADFEDAIKFVSGIFERIPNYVIQKQKQRQV